MHPDQKYIEALLNNDSALIREIYERFSGKILHMVLRHHGNNEDAKDVFNDSLMAIIIWARKVGFTLTCPFEGLLYLFCKRKWEKELEKRGGLRVTIIDEQTYTIDDKTYALADIILLFKDRKALVERNMEKLGESCRQLLYLSREGKKMEEVAALLNMTYGFARKKKAGCMKKLIDLVHQSPDFNSLKW